MGDRQLPPLGERVLPQDRMLRVQQALLAVDLGVIRLAASVARRHGEPALAARLTELAQRMSTEA
jgi:hypothetical protein